jgi:hypothetical protein
MPRAPSAEVLEVVVLKRARKLATRAASVSVVVGSVGEVVAVCDVMGGPSGFGF